MTELVMAEGKGSAVGVQKVMACISISAMVAFVAFTVVSLNELGTAQCKSGDDFDADFEVLSYILFGVFFAMVAVVAGVGLIDKNSMEVLEGPLKYVVRLIFNEGIFVLTGIALSFTTVAKCPLAITDPTNTSEYRDANFIDDAAKIQGYIVLIVGSFMIIHCAAVIKQWSDGAPDKDLKRDRYDSVILAIEFVVIAIGASIAASKYEYESEFHGMDNSSLLDSMCNHGDNKPFTGIADNTKGHLVLIFLAVLSAIHAVVTIGADVVMQDSDLRTVRGAVEPVVQAIIILLGMLAVAPLLFVMQNPPCNRMFGDLVHDSTGAMGVQLLVIAFITFSGTQIVKTYRKLAENSGTLGKALLGPG